MASPAGKVRTANAAMPSPTTFSSGLFARLVYGQNWSHISLAVEATRD